jgi:hypothetical protein
MSISYRYLGIVGTGHTAENPSGVLRVWTRPDGREVVESFRGSLTWERSNMLSPTSQFHVEDLVEIDQPGVDRFIEWVKDIRSKA